MPLKNGRARKSGHFVVGTRAGKEQRKRCLLSHKPIVQYYYVVLCEFESERKWIVGAVPTTWQKVTASLSTLFSDIFRKKTLYNLHGSICH